MADIAKVYNNYTTGEKNVKGNMGSAQKYL